MKSIQNVSYIHGSPPIKQVYKFSNVKPIHKSSAVTHSKNYVKG